MSATRSGTIPRVIVTRTMPESVEAHVLRLYDAKLNEHDSPFSAAQLGEALQQADVVITTVTDRWTPHVFDTPRIRTKLLANVGVGINHIALDAASEAGIMVSNTPDVVTEDTADVAIALMLMVMRRLGEGERHVRSGAWSGLRPTFMLGHSVRDKTLGVVGYGRIGRSVARVAHNGFGMKIVYHAPRDPRIDDPATAGPSGAERVATLEELLRRSDVVSLNCPATPETHHLINATTLAQMLPHAFLVNTARGDVVDEAALVEALRTGRIAGAGLDVYEFEPRVTADLLTMENVVLIPHLGSATIETRTGMGMRAISNVEAFLKGQDLPDRVV